MSDLPRIPLTGYPDECVREYGLSFVWDAGVSGILVLPYKDGMRYVAIFQDLEQSFPIKDTTSLKGNLGELACFDYLEKIGYQLGKSIIWNNHKANNVKSMKRMGYIIPDIELKMGFDTIFYEVKTTTQNKFTIKTNALVKMLAFSEWRNAHLNVLVVEIETLPITSKFTHAYYLKNIWNIPGSFFDLNKKYGDIRINSMPKYNIHPFYSGFSEVALFDKPPPLSVISNFVNEAI